MKNPGRPQVRWSKSDGAYLGYCADLFPWGGVCHASTRQAAERKLQVLIRKELQWQQALDPAGAVLSRLRRNWDATSPALSS